MNVPLYMRLVAAGKIVDSLGREWDPIKHPRGRDGRFIRVFKRVHAFLSDLDSEPWMTGRVVQINDNGSIRVEVTAVADPNKHGNYVTHQVDLLPNQVESVNEVADLGAAKKAAGKKPLGTYDFSEEAMHDFFINAGIQGNADLYELKVAAKNAALFNNGETNMLGDRSKYNIALYAKSISGEGKPHTDAEFADFLETLGVDPAIVDDTPDGMSGLKVLADKVTNSNSPDTTKLDSSAWFDEMPPLGEGVIREARLHGTDVRVRYYADGKQTVVWPDGTEKQHDKNKGSVYLAAHEANKADGVSPDAPDQNPPEAQQPPPQDGQVVPDEVESAIGVPTESIDTPPPGKFEILDDPGDSGDGYYPGTKMWGKYGAAGVMLRHKDENGVERFLMVQRGPIVSSNKGKWQLPGGALNSKENDYQGTARELWEELQTPDGYMDKITPVGEVKFEHESGWHYTNIAADVPEQFDPTVDGTETGAAGWFTKEEIAQLPLHPALADNLDNIFQKYNQPAPDTNVPETPAPDVAPTTKDYAPGEHIDASNWTQVGSQAGSNTGGVFQDENGQKWYVKNQKSETHAKNEALAAALYEAAGINSAPQILANTTWGPNGTASPWIDNEKNFYQKWKDPDYRKKVHKGFAFDAWIANWDVMGLGFDNIVTDKNGEPLRVDPGGALFYRAQGKPKGSFGDEVVELTTFKDKNNNAGKVFGDISPDDELESALKVTNITPEQIDSLVDAMDFPENGDFNADFMKKTLKARRIFIADHYGIPLPESEATPDPIPEDLNQEEAADVFNSPNAPWHGVGVNDLNELDVTASINDVVDSSLEYFGNDDNENEIIAIDRPTGKHSAEVMWNEIKDDLNGISEGNTEFDPDYLDTMAKGLLSVVNESKDPEAKDYHSKRINEFIDKLKPFLPQDDKNVATPDAPDAAKNTDEQTVIDAGIKHLVNEALEEDAVGLGGPKVQKAWNDLLEYFADVDEGNVDYNAGLVNEKLDAIIAELDVYFTTADENSAAEWHVSKLNEIKDLNNTIFAPNAKPDLPGPDSTDWQKMVDDKGAYRWGHGAQKLRVGDKVKSVNDGLTGTIVGFENNHKGIKVKSDADGKVKFRKNDSLQQADVAPEPGTPAPPKVSHYDPSSDNSLETQITVWWDNADQDSKFYFTDPTGVLYRLEFDKANNSVALYMSNTVEKTFYASEEAGLNLDDVLPAVEDVVKPNGNEPVDHGISLFVDALGTGSLHMPAGTQWSLDNGYSIDVSEPDDDGWATLTLFDTNGDMVGTWHESWVNDHPNVFKADMLDQIYANENKPDTSDNDPWASPATVTQALPEIENELADWEKELLWSQPSSVDGADQGAMQEAVANFLLAKDPPVGVSLHIDGYDHALSYELDDHGKPVYVLRRDSDNAIVNAFEPTTDKITANATSFKVWETLNPDTSQGSNDTSNNVDLALGTEVANVSSIGGSIDDSQAVADAVIALVDDGKIGNYVKLPGDNARIQLVSHPTQGDLLALINPNGGIEAYYDPFDPAVSDNISADVYDHVVMDGWPSVDKVKLDIGNGHTYADMPSGSKPLLYLDTPQPTVLVKHPDGTYWNYYTNGTTAESSVEPEYYDNYPTQVVKLDSPPTPDNTNTQSLDQLKTSLPHTIGEVKKLYPGMSDAQAKQYRNARFALDDMEKAEQFSSSWQKSLDKAKYNLKQAGPQATPTLTKLNEWEASLKGENKPNGIDLGSGYKKVPEGSKVFAKYTEMGYENNPVYAVKYPNGKIYYYYGNGDVIEMNTSQDLEKTLLQTVGWSPYDDSTPDAPDTQAAGTPDFGGNYAKLPDGAVVHAQYNQDQDLLNGPVYAVKHPDGLNYYYYPNGSKYQVTEDVETLTSKPGWSPYASDANKIPGDPDVPVGKKVASYYGHTYEKQADGTWKSDTNQNVLEVGSPAEADINKYAKDDSLVPPVQEESGTTGVYRLDAFGNVIKVGDQVESLNDGLVGQVLEFQANDIGVGVWDSKAGKKRFRSRKTLKNLSPNAAPPKKPVKMPDHKATVDAASNVETSAPSSTALPTKVAHEPDPNHPMFGTEKPEMPEAPAAETTQFVDDAWMKKANENYKSRMKAKNSNWVEKELSASSTFSQFQAVRDHGDLHQLQQLLSQKRITQEMYDDAKAQIGVNAAKIQKIQDAHDAKIKQWQDDLKEWYKANGLPIIQLKGMDHALSMDGHDARKWFDKNVPAGGLNANKKLTSEAAYGVSAQKGSNQSHFLRDTAKVNSFDDAWLDANTGASTLKVIKALDAAVAQSPPIPEDVIVTRTFDFKGLVDPVTRKPLVEGHDLTKLVGSVQQDFGFAETSVGSYDAGGNVGYSSGRPVRMQIMLPKGTRGVYTETTGQNFWHGGDTGERGYILARGYFYYIHSVNYKNGKWYINAEIIPKDVGYEAFDYFQTVNPFDVAPGGADSSGAAPAV